ncbi:MAG: hypothetical protein Q9216_006330 [Gyalolechia sp. 2 TL-2023]
MQSLNPRRPVAVANPEIEEAVDLFNSQPSYELAQLLNCNECLQWERGGGGLAKEFAHEERGILFRHHWKFFGLSTWLMATDPTLPDQSPTSPPIDQEDKTASLRSLTPTLTHLRPKASSSDSITPSPDYSITSTSIANRKCVERSTIAESSSQAYSSSQPSSTPSLSHSPFTSYHSSVQDWIDQLLPAVNPSATPQRSSQRDRQDHRPKRKRSISIILTDLEASTPTIPLTKKALKKHLALTMSSDPSTPHNRVFSPSQRTPTTESTAQPPTSSSKPSLSQADIRGYMEQHRMFMRKRLLDKPEMAGFRDLVLRVVDTERPSGRKPNSERKWQMRTENLDIQNEATMLDYILPLLIKDGRKVPVEDPFAHYDPFTQHESSAHQEPFTHQESSAHSESSTHTTSSVIDDVWEDFEDSGLAWNVDREFARTYLPNSYANIGYEEKIATALAKQRGVKNPKPDRTYGLKPNHLPPPKNQPALLRDETKTLLNAIPGLSHVFFLLEVVSSNGSTAKAMNQACRGGTVAVFIQRLLLASTGQRCMDAGPDFQTYVYTATIDDSAMSFYVNFALVRDLASGGKDVSFHMEHIYTYALQSKDAVLYLRRVCHNILDWGVRSRRPMLESRVVSIYNYDRLKIEQDAAKDHAEKELAAEQAQEGKGKKRETTPGSVYKSLFRTSKDREHLLRTIQELQPLSNAGRANKKEKEDEMNVIVDAFLSYVRESEQTVQGRTEQAIQEASHKADEEINQSLDASRKTFEDLEKQKTRFEKETLDTANTVSDLQRQNKELREERDKEIQSAIESHYADYFQHVNDLLLRNDELRSELQSQHESYLQDLAKLEVEKVALDKVIHDNKAVIEELQRRIVRYVQEIESYEEKPVLHDLWDVVCFRRFVMEFSSFTTSTDFSRQGCNKEKSSSKHTRWKQASNISNHHLHADQTKRRRAIKPGNLPRADIFQTACFKLQPKAELHRPLPRRMPPEMRMTPFTAPMDPYIKPHLSARQPLRARPSPSTAGGLPPRQYIERDHPSMTARRAEIASGDQRRTIPTSSISTSSGSVNLHRDTNIFFFDSSQSARTKDKYRRGISAILPYKERSSSRTEGEKHRNNPQQSSRTRSLLRRSLWAIPVLWLLLVQLLRYFPINNDVSAPEEGIQATSSTDDKFASALEIQKSIEAALASTPTAKLHELSTQAAVHCQDTILSHREYSSRLLHTLFDTNGTHIDSHTATTLLDQTVAIFLFYTWPRDNTPWHNKRFALAQAAHLVDDEFPALHALGTSYSGNLSEWTDTMGHISGIIATEHEAATGELNSFAADPLAYFRELYHAQDTSTAAESSRTLGGLVCRTLKLLVSSLEEAQRVMAETYAFEHEVRRAREECVTEGGWCGELVRVLEGVPSLALVV